MDKKEFEIKVAPLRHNVYSLAYKICGNVDDADDVAQDTLLKMWSVRDKIERYKSIEALAMTICRNEAINRLREKGHSGISIDDVPHATAEGWDADRPLLTRESELEVDRLLASLPQSQQIVLRMRHIDGLELSEISKLIGSTEGNVRVILSRARHRIRELFKNKKI